MIKSVKAITASSHLSMFFLGVSASLLGAAARNIGLSPSQIGLLIAAQNLGFILSVSVSGALSDTHEKPKILVVGCFSKYNTSNPLNRHLLWSLPTR
jgi:MFS family permease